MSLFDDLFEHNDWANQQLLAVTDELTQEQLDALMPELGGSVLGLLTHTALVETAFLGLVSWEQILRPKEDWAHAEIRELFGTTAEGYRRELSKLMNRLADNVEVPWFGRSFTIEQALVQVATHSVQHRAGVVFDKGQYIFYW